MSNTLRLAIREMIISENYNVSIVGTPITRGEKRKRGEKPPEEITANVVLMSDDLLDFIEKMNDKDILNSAASEADDAIMQRIDAIRDRVGSAAAKLALSAYQEIKEDPAMIELSLFNLPDENGVVKEEHPEFREYTIPPVLQQLAFADKSAGGAANVGKGEALGILMFGRMKDAGNEPDLIVSPSKQFSVKYFRSKSDSVRLSAGLGDYAEDTDTIIGLTRKIRDLAGVQDNSIGRPKMQKILSTLAKNYTEEEGMPSREAVIEMIRDCGVLWDTLPVSTHPVLALVGVSSPIFEVIEDDKIRLGVIRFDGNVPKIELASPAYSRIIVSPSLGDL